MNATSDLALASANAPRLDAPLARRLLVGTPCRFAWLYFVGFGLVIAAEAHGPSSDTAAIYRALAWVLAVSAGGAVLWSIVDRRSASTSTLHRALEVFLRGVLFLAMMGYGLGKVLKAQFPFPDGVMLSTPIGQLAPIELLWAFMGYSTVYTVFAGVVEVLGAVLLLFRRTKTLGALLVCAAMTNVVMLNVGYDVCVKVLSVHLLLMGMVLVAPDLRRLADFFFLNRSIAPRPEIHRTVWRRRLVVGVKCAAVLLAVTALTRSAIMISRQAHRSHGTSVPEGLYEAEGAGQPPSASAADGGLQRWKRIAFEDSGLVFQRESGRSDFYRVVHNAQQPSGGVLTLEPFGETPASRVELRWRPEGSDGLVVEGTVDGHAMSFRGRHVPSSAFPLVTHGTHWVKEGFD